MSDFHYQNQYSPEEVEEVRALPREFQVIQESRVPLLQSGGDSSQDFVIVAEFSELEGPVPLCTIPTSIPNKIGICLNNFAVHLMSTDYQVNAVGHFKISQDTQVLRKNVFKNIHVFMQYFTLYDIKARGFVRPFCFGYVSKDHVKLDTMLDSLITQFDKVTKVLKFANRRWFAAELEQYLEKLGTVKDSFIENRSQGGGGATGDNLDENEVEDDDAITLQQIGHQYSEIHNILGTVLSFESPGMQQEIEKMSQLLLSSQESPLGAYLLNLGINLELDAAPPSISSTMPLLHPLKLKGECLRPLTTLGQLGTVYLIWKLILLQQEHQRDLIFSQMSQLTQDFQRHCRHVRKSSSPKNNDNPSNSGDKEGLSLMANSNQVLIMLENVHSASLPTSAADNKSTSSYHTVSEPESETVMISDRVDLFYDPTTVPSDRQSISTVSSSQSQPDEPPVSPPGTPSPVEIIQSKPWWEYLQENVPRGAPGYGILKLFRNHPHAPHILYSILIGRTIVICGREEERSKIGRILTSLIPLVPCHSAAKSWKLLRWHRGVLVNCHIKDHKLIGLCIPERLEVHDLIHDRDKNSVTIFHILQKTILGPAYSGGFLAPFQPPTRIQCRFTTDTSFLTYLGGILTEIETKIYMHKCLKSRNKGHSREISLKGSDSEIVRYLASLAPTLDQIVEIF